ncbi:Uncharacterized protein dnm_099760 [Desulfonema magnum]|uniref:Uncharacterized protein n=1 Tax=Desulfonema magnum TaxID=45655 RepID=A0A975GWD5_9BACT|nr:Uncharacterized protein dnm_099760 [Desulfonema magnum]
MRSGHNGQGRNPAFSGREDTSSGKKSRVSLFLRTWSENFSSLTHYSFGLEIGVPSPQSKASLSADRKVFELLRSGHNGQGRNPAFSGREDTSSGKKSRVSLFLRTWSENFSSLTHYSFGLEIGVPSPQSKASLSADRKVFELSRRGHNGQGRNPAFSGREDTSSGKKSRVSLFLRTWSENFSIC